MARKRRPEETPSYQPKPEAPATPAQEQRAVLVQAVLAKQMTISEAARQLGIERVNMQTIVHRAQAALLEALAPRPSGPPPKPARQAELEQEVERLRKQNAKLTTQLQAADEMMGAAGEIIRSLRGLPPRTSSPRSTSSSRSRKPQTPSEPDEDPEPEPTTPVVAAALARMTTMPEQGRQLARVLGVGHRTLRRYLARLALGEPLLRRRGGRRRPVEPVVAARVQAHVRELGGLVGAASLAHTIDGVSRRAAAAIKQHELTAMERERQGACARVEVTVPGVMRAFDAMHIGPIFALIAGDACVPFRTSAEETPAYDGPHVAEVLDADFTEHGAPLVARLDRAKCHETEDVLSVFRRHGVQLLHGPPRHPQYYGQLERQNREHRAWLVYGLAPGEALGSGLARMRAALNGLWRRPTLDWLTAEELWMLRPPINDNRDELHDWVQARAAHIRENDVPEDLAMRLAIEQALTERGYLKVIPGQQVLCG